MSSGWFLYKTSINSFRGYLRHRIYRDIIYNWVIYYAVLRSLRLKCSLNCTALIFFFHIDETNCSRKNEDMARNSSILFTSVIILSSLAFIMALFYVCILCKTQNKANHYMHQQISISAHQRHINLYENINIWCELGWINNGSVDYV